MTIHFQSFKPGRTVDLQLTQMPCGNDCGMFYQLFEVVTPDKIRAAALKDGWTVAGGRDALICSQCAKRT